MICSSSRARSTGSFMRIFIAIDITPAIRESIRALLAELKQTEARIRWSRPEGLHITLKFLGEVPPAKIADVKAGLTSIRTPAPFSISVQGSGFFPGESSPRVIWLGVDGGNDLGALASLSSSERWSPSVSPGRIGPIPLT